LASPASRAFTDVNYLILGRSLAGRVSNPIYLQGGPAKVRPTYILLVTFGT